MAQVDLNDLDARVLTKLDSNDQLYPQVDRYRLINEASRNLNLFTGFSQAQVPAGLTVANWQWYRVPSPIVFPMRMFLDGKILQKSSIVGTADVSPRWIRGAAKSITRSWVPVGTTLFAIIDPDPVGGKYLECWGVTTPALLVSGTDTLNLDDEYADLIVEYAFINLTLKEGGKPFADASSGYNNWIKRARKLQRWEAKINPRYWLEVASKVEVPAA